MKGIYIKKYTDLNSVCECYMKAFKKRSFTVVLGKEYVMKSLEWFLDYEKSFLYAIQDEKNKTAGFVGAYIKTQNGIGSTGLMLTYSSKKRQEILKKRPWLIFHKIFFLRLLKLFSENPKFILTKILKSNSNKNFSQIKDLKKEEYSLGLIVIGVDPKYQGKIVAKLLMEEMISKAKKLNINKAHLSVDSNNHKAIKYYKKFGWKESPLISKSSSSVGMTLEI